MNNLEIVKKRKNLGLTQKELADLIGVSKNTIVNYEKGLKIPESKLPILNKILNIDPNEKTNIAHEPELKYEKLPGYDEKIKAHIKELKEKIEALDNYNSSEFDKQIEIIKLLLDIILIIKNSKKNHLHEL